MGLLLLELKDDPNDPFTLFNLGMTEHHFGKQKEAIDWLTQSLANATPQMTHTRKIFAILVESYRDDGQIDASMETAEKGLALFPADPELHFHAANIERGRGNPQSAIEHLRAYGEDTSDHFSSIDLGILTYRRWTLLGELNAQLGNYPEAKKWFGVCMEREPWYEPAASGLFDAALQHGDMHMASLALEAMIAASGPTTEWTMRACRYAEATGGQSNVIPYISALANRYPNTEEPRLTLARVLIDSGRVQEGVSRLHQLSQQGSARAGAMLSGAKENSQEDSNADHQLTRVTEKPRTKKPKKLRPKG